MNDPVLNYRRDAHHLAAALAERGAKTTVIEQLSGLSKEQARRIIRATTGVEPHSGPLPVSIATLLCNRRRHARLSAIARIFLALNPSPAALDAEALVRTWDLFVYLHGPQGGEDGKPITFTELFILARDLRIGNAELRRCQKCGLSWLLCHQCDTHLVACPYCKLGLESCFTHP